jgi:thiol peroxidase
MIRKKALACLITAFFLMVAGCASKEKQLPMVAESVQPGSSVTKADDTFALLGTPLAIGTPLPATALTDAMTMETVDLSKERGEILFLSVVPSLDTKVCEAQTHYLAEEGDKLPEAIRRITISRDTPFAQKRFANEAKLTDILYLSDYKTGSFGKETGLLMDDLMLLARSVVLVDRAGIIRYIQVVPEITHLPEMETAFDKALELAAE